MTTLNRKVALVTAASKGIGAATAIAFGKAGYDVIVNYYSSKDLAEQVVATIKESGGNAVAVQANVFTEAGIQQLFESVGKETKKLDVLVNNAGSPLEPAFGEYTYDDLNKSIFSNFTSAVMCTQSAVPLMSKGGCILFTSSINGTLYGSNPKKALYSAGKAAVTNFMRSMAELLAPKGIRCNAVSPGMTKTPLWDAVSDDYAKMRLDMTLQKEWVQPEEIADAFVFLAKTPHVNAENIIIDAGWMKKF